MKRSIKWIGVAVLCVTGSLHAQNNRQQAWQQLSLREKIGQTMLMLPDRQAELAIGNGSLETFFQRYPVTGFFMGWKLFTGIEMKDRTTFLKKSVVEYQNASKMPLLFQQDYEHGINLPGMTNFPNEMALGAANDPVLAYQYGCGLAMEARSLGVQWVLHPVADLNLNPINPITNTRCISDDPDKAIRLLSRQISGLQQTGVAATIKHFPGDGVDSRDQHLTTTCNSLTREQWLRYHGKVFQALIDSGVAAIMPGHITLPAFQKQKKDGFYLPATLSEELLTGLLKKQMRFKGVIVSDAMTMGGFRGWYPNQLEGEVQSFLAGVDILLWPSYAFMDTLEARINRKEIPMSRLDDAVSRIWAMKSRFGLLQEQRNLLPEMTAQQKAGALQTAAAVSGKAVTLVRNRHQGLPVTPATHKKILVVAITTESRKGGDGGLATLRHFQQSLQQQGFDVDFQRNILYETQGWEEDLSKKYDKIIIAIVRQTHRPFGPLQLYDDEAQTAWAVNAMPGDKLIAVSFGTPYVLNEYFERVPVCINAYSNNEAMHDAVVQVITGKMPATGISPVVLTPGGKLNNLKK